MGSSTSTSYQAAPGNNGYVVYREREYNLTPTITAVTCSLEYDSTNLKGNNREECQWLKEIFEEKLSHEN